jgi:phospholipid/cholesterol/gamma-HCH transport system permease protein
VTVIALVTGATVVLQAQANMPRFGVSQYFGDLLIVVAVKELGPFFTALVVIGRSGAALAAYIGNMRVTREIDALEVMGIDPVRFVVLPAFWGMVVAVTCLNLYFAGIAIVGGLAVAGATVNLPFVATLGKVMEALTLAHVLTSFFKGVLFGLAIGIASSYHGLRVQSIRGVPQAAIKAVVLSMALVLVLNLVITMAANALGEVFANA